MDGAGAPEKINAVIRDFDVGRDNFFDSLEKHAVGKNAFVRALSELIEARHNAAHAKPGTDPSPSDAKGWIVSSYWLVRAIDSYIGALVVSNGKNGVGDSF